MIIVSELAKGIDAVAHETVLECGLKTIAVLVGGLQHIYTPENKTLAVEILKHGALVSEFPLGIKHLLLVIFLSGIVSSAVCQWEL